MKQQTVQVGARIPEELYHYLKRLARKQSYLNNSDTTLADIIRETLLEQYPIPEEEAEIADEKERIDF